MSKYRFSAEERYAVYAVHNEKCYICNIAVDLKSMQVDHIIPESLLSEPKELQKVKTAYGLASEFSINSFENWMPSCSPCNGKKSSTVFEFTVLIQMLLQRAQEKAQKARELANKIINRREIAKALNVLQRAKNGGFLTKEDIEKITPLVNFHFDEVGTITANSPLILTPFMMAIPNSSDHYKKVLTKDRKFQEVGNINGITFMKPIYPNSQFIPILGNSSSKGSGSIFDLIKSSSMNTKDASNIINPGNNPYTFEGSKMCSKCGFALMGDAANCTNCDNIKLDSKDVIF